MPFIEDYLFFTNSIAAGNQWSLDPYNDEDDDPWNFGGNASDDDDDDDD